MAFCSYFIGKREVTDKLCEFVCECVCLVLLLPESLLMTLKNDGEAGRWLGNLCATQDITVP